jgi:hypothetical protein
MFIGALRDYAIAVQSVHANKIKRLTVNEDEKPGAESSFKVWPTNADRALFRSTMMAGAPDPLLKPAWPDGKERIAAPDRGILLVLPPDSGICIESERRWKRHRSADIWPLPVHENGPSASCNRA